MLVADSGICSHPSRLINSPRVTRRTSVYTSSLVLDDYRGSSRRFSTSGVDHDVHLKALPKLLGLPNLVSYMDINEFVDALHEPSSDVTNSEPILKASNEIPHVLEVFVMIQHDILTFAAIRFLRFCHGIITVRIALTCSWVGI